VELNPWFILLYAIQAYRNLLLVYIIINLLQSFADLRLPDPLRPAASFVFDVCEPFLRIWRGMLPALRMGGMGLDLSPIIGFIVLQIAAEIVARLV
jgi:uncharacterized protein YggT (Ycf19 family)